MNNPNRRENQKGSTLVIALILVSVAAVVTMTSMRGSLMQEKMVANQNIKAVSFMAAESGAASFNKWLKDPNTTWNSTGWQNTIPTTAAGNVNIGTQGYYWIGPNDVTWGANSVTVKVRGYAKSDNSGTANAKTTLQITMTKPTAGGGSGIYIGSGMIAGGNINMNGSKNITGSLYANGNINLNGTTTITNGTVNAHGNVNVNGVSNSVINQGVPTISVPTISDAFLAEMSTKASVKTCNINLTGDQGGQIYYCAGNATIAGNFSNATVVATGNVSKNGSGQLGGAGKSATAVTLAIIAKGNVNFNGSSNDYSVIWTNGDYNHNGSGTVRGTIVAKGNINRNGSFTFQEMAEVQNNQVTTSPVANSPSRVTLWKEILE
jgi:Tfp pilus assembly protein PilX